MASEAQILINRRFVQQSTGPRSLLARKWSGITPLKRGYLAHLGKISKETLAGPYYIMQNKANLSGVQMDVNFL